MKIKDGEVEKTVKWIIERYLATGDMGKNEFEYMKKYSRYLKGYRFVKR